MSRTVSRQFGSSSDVKRGSGESGGGGLPDNGAVLHIAAMAGSTITLEKGGIVVTVLNASSGHTEATGGIYANWYYGVLPINYGTWTVTAVLSGISETKTVTISTAEEYTLAFGVEHYLYHSNTFSSVFSHDTLVTKGSITYNANYFQISTTASSLFDVYIRWIAVDLTPFSKIVADMTCTSGGSNADTRLDIFVTQDSTVKNVRAATTKTTSTIKGTDETTHRTVTLDVSGLSGFYYVAVGTDSNGSSWANSRRVRTYSVLLTQN